VSFQPGANLYTAGFGLRPENIEVPHLDVRAPTTSDTLFPVGKWWLFVGNSLWYLLNQTSTGGKLRSNWVQVSGSGGSGVTSVTGSNGVDSSPTTGSVVVSGINATTSSVGVASFDPLDFTVSPGGEVSIIGTSTSYVNVVGPTTYTASLTDYFISVDSSGGAVTVNLPAAPPNGKQYIVKDRTGSAPINNITVQSSAGTTIDTNPNTVFSDAFDSLEVFFHTGTPNNYEVF